MLNVIALALFGLFLFWDSLKVTNSVSKDTVLICAYIVFAAAKIVDAIKGKYDRIP